MSPADMHRAVDDYLTLRRSLGFKLDEAERFLHDFVDHLERTGVSVITVDSAMAWATAPARAQPAYWAKRLGVLRQFAAHLQAFDPAVEVPPAGLLPARAGRAQPFIYSPAQITALLEATTSIRDGLRAATYRSLLGLLAVTGMRVGEAIRMDRTDVDWLEETLRVTDTKFGKSRLLPVHPTTTAALRRYLELRDRQLPQPASTSLFTSTAGTRLFYSNVHKAFQQLIVHAGIVARSAACRPRLHDLRHTFAVNTLAGFYRDGHDVQTRLPLLSTYLGHTAPSSTYWYLSATPELLGLAAQRLDSQIGGRS